MSARDETTDPDLNALQEGAPARRPAEQEAAPASGGPSRAFRALSEIAPAAQRALPRQVWDYGAGGAGTEATVRRNRDALARVLLRPQVLRGVAERDTSTTLLGVRLALPVVLAPVGGLALFTPGGALTAARAAHAAGTVPFVGILTSPRLEDVAARTSGSLFFQLYVQGDRSWLEGMVERVEAAGFAALCVTVDTPVHPRRERDIHNDFVPQEARARPNLDGAAALSPRERARYRMGFVWDDLAWLKGVTRLPLVVKGILTPEDATLAIEHGADVVYVSNHGGRQLDHAPATIEALPGVVQAVAGRAQIVVDSGFARGTDVVKALALGADAVAIGRLMCWALAAGGQIGLESALQLVQEEISATMAQLGVREIAALDPARVTSTPA